MKDNTFDDKEAKKFLLAKEEKEKALQEQNRLAVLEKVILTLKEEFQGSTVEVYLIGSVTQPFRFSANSDIDIVLKNYPGDRFEFWAKLEGKLDRRVEIIVFETCHFQDFVLKQGLKVV